MATDFDLSSFFIPALHKPSSLLPIARHRQNLLYLIEKYPIVIVVGQTGSGKTTQLPQFLDQAGWCADGKVIGVTQVGKSIFFVSSWTILSLTWRGSSPGEWQLQLLLPELQTK